MQIREDFGGLSLCKLARLGLGVYDLIPSYRESCPLCGGVGCAVRQGLYRRRVVDVGGGVIHRLPVPRFRCRGRGHRQAASSTFSVLPPNVLPRCRLSLALMLRIAELVHSSGSIPAALDRLALTSRGLGDALVVEETTAYRVLARLGRRPPGAAAAPPPPGPGRCVHTG